MPTTIVERYGSLSATGVAREATFGTPLTPTSFLPMTGNGIELDPGLFWPKVMMGQRDTNIFALYGQYKVAGAVTGPLFPSNGALFMTAAIGSDAAAGYGVTGSTPANSTTLNGATTAGATSVTLTSATGYATNGFVQVDTNNTATPTTAEVRKITNVTSNTLTLDQALTYAHNNGATVTTVVAPYTHTVAQANTLPSLTVEKNLGGFESLQFAGARINKLGINVQATNTEASINADIIAKSATVLTTPSTIAVTNESPYVFAEATLSLFSQSLIQAQTVDLSIENGLKPTYTFNQAHTLQFLTPVTRTLSAKCDLVFTSLDDATWGYYTQMVNAGEGALSLTLTHPSSAGSFTLTMPRARIKTYGDAVKMEDVILTTLNIDVALNIPTLTTVTGTIVNSGVYLPY